MNPIVVKFGGSSLATAAQFEKVAAIIREAPARRYVVASAPGKRFDGDTKVTDLLYRCYDAACAGQEFAPVLDEIRQRFADIIGALRLSANLEPDFAAIEAHLRQSPQRDNISIPNYWPRISASALSTRRRWSCSGPTARSTRRRRIPPSGTRL